MKKIRRAIISVTDKTGVVDFARELFNVGVEIISTGGTADLLTRSGITVIPISSYTGFPEMLDGRLKTLHPKIHGGILGMSGNAKHQKEMNEFGIPPIDMVVVNLYAFEDTIKRGCTFDEAIENIDIGGPTMIRASAKNYNDVAVVVDPADYADVLKELRERGGALSPETRLTLARKVFRLTARYDAAISNYLGTSPEKNEGGAASGFPETFTVQFRKIQDLRYGENPHQSAALYASGRMNTAIAAAKKLQGKELSFNNILDLNTALNIAYEFSEPAAVIIKHNNPCGAAISKEGILRAYELAYACDKTSAFGGVVGFNRKVTAGVAALLSSIFLEAVIAPDFDKGAMELLSAKKNLRLLAVGDYNLNNCDGFNYDIKKYAGGVLLQTQDRESAADLKTVTKRAPDEKELSDLLFAWNVCKQVKSNAIILAADGRTVGIGAGQMSRIDSTRISIIKAADAGLTVKGCVLASDAFFPFRDNVDAAASQGITAIIQPGGSIKDEEVIKAADEHGMAMVFTGIRHFKH